MFEHFSEKAIKTIFLAQEETRRAKHKIVGTEQILLGLLAEGTGVAAKLLTNEGVSLELVRSEIEKKFGCGRNWWIPANMSFNSEAKISLQIAESTALRLNSSYIDTEHLLLGLLQQPDGRATLTLQDLAINITEIITQIV